MVTRCKANLPCLKITCFYRQETGAGMTNLARVAVVHAVFPLVIPSLSFPSFLSRYSFLVIPTVFKLLFSLGHSRRF